MPPERDWRLRIEDILESIAAIDGYTRGLCAEAFAADRKTVDAVTWNLAIIGEATAHTPEEVRSRHPALPWRKMQAMRNFLIHDYPAIRHATVWDTTEHDLPPLVPQLRRILEEGR